MYSTECQLYCDGLGRCFRVVCIYSFTAVFLRCNRFSMNKGLHINLREDTCSLFQPVPFPLSTILSAGWRWSALRARRRPPSNANDAPVVTSRLEICIADAAAWGGTTLLPPYPPFPGRRSGVTRVLGAGVRISDEVRSLLFPIFVGCARDRTVERYAME